MLTEEQKIKINSYFDYKQLEREIQKLYRFTNDINIYYDYINNLKGASFTNVNLDTGAYFDFNYKDMCLTIQINDKGIVELTNSIELWNKEILISSNISIDELENEIRKILIEINEKKYKTVIRLENSKGIFYSLSNIIDNNKLSVCQFEEEIINKNFNKDLLELMLKDMIKNKILYEKDIDIYIYNSDRIIFELTDCLDNKVYLIIEKKYI